MSTRNSALTPLRGAALALVCLTSGFSATASAQIFGGIGGGGISDNSITGQAVTFNATGLTGRVRTVAVVVNLQHTFVGDLTVQLVSPNGLARLNLMGRVGAGFGSPNGDSTNLAGSYAFDDSAPSDLWVTAAGLPNDSAIPASVAFRTSVAGVPNRGKGGGCSSYLSLAFGGLTAAQANGTWVLRVTDGAAGDVGTVNGASSTLSITMEEPPLFADGFELGPRGPVPIDASSTVGSCTPAISSPTGSGVSDYVLARPLPSVWRWIVKVNTAAGDGAVLPAVDFGGINDDPYLGDFDGDGLTDFTVLRVTGGRGGRFLVRRSSRPNDVPLDVSFGTSLGKSAKLLNDYDGDHITDFATYTQGGIVDATGELQVRKSSTGAIVTYLVPFAGDSPVASMRDGTGDGLVDLVRRNPLSVYRIYSGADGTVVNTFTFGVSTDTFFPGQVTGSNATDITTVRRQLNPATGMMQRVFQTRDTASGAISAEVYFPGEFTGSFVTPGDYDGDGFIDYAIYRPSGQAGASRFEVRPSATPNTLIQQFFGDGTEYGVAAWDTHSMPDL